MISTDKPQLNINVLTQEQYEQAKADETLDADGLYMVPETEAIPTAVDYIVEEVDDGYTRWRKWNSGISEFWFESDATYTINTARGNWYSSNEVSRDFPNDLFVATPSMVFGQALSTAAYVIFAQCTGLSLTTYKYRLVANASVASATHSVSAYAIGRWK